MRYSNYFDFDKDTLNMIALSFGRKNIYFSKTQAAKIVGGEARLIRLMMQGKIRADKPTCKQNGKWFCNGADVIRNMQF